MLYEPVDVPGGTVIVVPLGIEPVMSVVKSEVVPSTQLVELVVVLRQSLYRVDAA